jgi:O-acetyl-ADP-ribose deacetylase (regulator of RNase III)
MDIFWANASALSLPSSQRVEVLVHDGASDLSLWPGPGADRVLLDNYGPGLREALEVQRVKHGGKLEVGDVIRVHAGKLHCNYLLWVASRGPEVHGEQSQAPDLNVIEQAVTRCLEIAASNGSVSVAFSALGEGPGARPAEERLACIVRASHRYYETCVASGRAAKIEIVRVCDLRGGVTAAARRLVGRLAQSAPEVVGRPVQTTLGKPVRAASTTATRSSGGSSKSSAKGTGARRNTNVLDAGEVERKRASARPYDRFSTYREGDWFLHAKFGVGQVKRVSPEGSVDVLFEDASVKKMLHARTN